MRHGKILPSGPELHCIRLPWGKGWSLCLLQFVLLQTRLLSLTCARANICSSRSAFRARMKHSTPYPGPHTVCHSYPDRYQSCRLTRLPGVLTPAAGPRFLPVAHLFCVWVIFGHDRGCQTSRRLQPQRVRCAVKQDPTKAAASSCSPTDVDVYDERLTVRT